MAQNVVLNLTESDHTASNWTFCHSVGILPFLDIFVKLTQVLKWIEDNKTNQHEGSVMIGKILTEMYIDSAIRGAKHIDTHHETQTTR